METKTSYRIASSAFKLYFLMVLSASLVCCSDSDPVVNGSNSNPPGKNNEEEVRSNESESAPVERKEAGDNESSEVFNNLNAAFLDEFCGIWQLYKRKPHDEPERMITDNSYLDLKKDFTYTSNGWIITGSGHWLPAFNYTNTGEKMTFVTFLHERNTRANVTTVIIEMVIENGTKLLKVSDLETNSFDYYIRK